MPWRSDEWFDSPEIYSWLRQAAFQAQGFTRDGSSRRPIIGICNTFSELVHCNAHLRELAAAVKRGVWQEGGFPLEFPVSSLGEFNLRPTAMLWRNLMSMDVEEAIRGNPLDGVVLLGGCDKTTPALLMGAASADVPAILLTGGPQLKGNWRGEELGSCTDCRRYQQEFRAGNISEKDWRELQSCIIRSPGHCMTMGTASTMAILGEALGMALPGNGAIPAVDSRRLQLAEETGRTIVQLLKLDVHLRPRDLLTAGAFDNAIRVLHAIGGSANAVIHLIALAGRVGIDLPLARFDELSRTTPMLVNLKPSGEYLMEDFFYAGGVPALLKEMASLLNLDEKTVVGQPWRQILFADKSWNRKVIYPLRKPLHAEGGLAVLTGSLAPRGALIKVTAATPALMQHRGRAIVFDNHDEMQKRIDDPDLDVRADDVLVLRNSGPVGAPGMPEWGFLPIPKKLLQKGVRDMVRVSDARMSGTAFGTVVVHVAPESAVGGPLAVVQTGDTIALDVPKRRIDLLIPDAELKRRLKKWRRPAARAQRGYACLFEKHVLQADQGCDFDFLRSAGRASTATRSVTR